MVGLLFAATSCTSYKKCVDLYGVQSGDTVFVCVEKEVISYVAVPADSAQMEVELGDIYFGRVVQTDTSKNLSIRAYLDSVTNTIKFEARMKPQVIRDTVRIKEKIPCPPKLYLEKPLTWRDKTMNYYLLIAGWAFPFLTIFTLFIIRSLVGQWTRKKYS